MRNVNDLKRDCEIYGMPLMAEPLMIRDNAKRRHVVDGDIFKTLSLIRQAAERGTDIIKAAPAPMCPNTITSLKSLMASRLWCRVGDVCLRPKSSPARMS